MGQAKKKRRIPRAAKIVRGIRTLSNVTGIRKDKVFAIGFNKCGTSSLHALFEHLGRPSYHGVDWRTLENTTLLRRFDCFSDGIPTSLDRIDQLYPKTKYILQVRDLRSWIYSRLAHIDRAKSNGNYNGGESWDSTEYAVTEWIKQRNVYHLRALNHFKNRPGDLLIVNFVRDVNAANKICRFLGYIEGLDKPKENVNPKKIYPEEHTRLFQTSLNQLAIDLSEAEKDILVPSLLKADQAKIYPTDTSELDAKPWGYVPNIQDGDFD